ncbi:MAG: trimeric intracellular cation channel family protein [Acidimicrobiia bacterium]
MTVTGLDPTLERVLDIVGVFVFALSGASLAVQRRFDVVGIAALATATALGGGIVRDVLLGERPPAAMRDQTYLIAPLVATVVVLVGHRAIEVLRRPVLVFDAGGLALFCVVGTAKALDHGLGVVAAVLLGVITAVGGGVLRDVLAREVPSVFRADSGLYAVPATLGSIAVAAVWSHEALGAVAAATIAVGVLLLRLLAMRFHWRAPTARGTS